MKRTILAIALLTLATYAGAQGKSQETKAQTTVAGACTIVGNSLITDMRDSNCFPQFDEAKCSYYMHVPVGKTVGAAQADVDDMKTHGQKVMKYAASQACEGKSNCGFYVVQFGSTANCDGKVVQDMPGGEYRGLTAAAARNIQEKANREGEAASKKGKDRGDKTKNPKNKGKVWGAED